ncbi:MAG: hypothetical protein K2N43_02970 [Lachnospiraceae bacterium]|nr:hypothetical protein [Lachnospiraceae bacterium]
MDQSLIYPRFYADIFGGREYDMDVEENLEHLFQILTAEKLTLCFGL